MRGENDTLQHDFNGDTRARRNVNKNYDVRSVLHRLKPKRNTLQGIGVSKLFSHVMQRRI